jgi:hypothetical protein
VILDVGRIKNMKHRRLITPVITASAICIIIVSFHIQFRYNTSTMTGSSKDGTTKIDFWQSNSIFNYLINGNPRNTLQVDKMTIGIENSNLQPMFTAMQEGIKVEMGNDNVIVIYHKSAQRVDAPEPASRAR